MKNKKPLLKISVVVASILILAIITLMLLGKKERVGYLSEFKLNIDKTLEINRLDINKTKQLFTIDNKLDNTAITNYIFTNASITNYSYDFRIKYYSKVFRNSDIYSVYPKIDSILNDNSFIKEIKMDEEGSPFGDLISTKTIDTEKIDNISYILKFKYMFLLVISIIIVPTFIYTITNNNYFIFIIVLLGIFLFIFHFWLGFPGYGQEWDWYRLEATIFNKVYTNVDPVIFPQILRLLFNLFGVHSYYFFAIQLFCWYGGTCLLILSLYLKYKNKLFIFIYLLNLIIANIFLLNFILIKDFIFSAHLWFLSSLIFFQFFVNIENKIIKLSVRILTLFIFLLTLLLRHNAIVTMYPILILFAYIFIKKENDLKKYMYKFFSVMFLLAVLLILIVKLTPYIFVSKEKIKINPGMYVFFHQLQGIATLTDDPNIIPKEWYNEGKDFNYLKYHYNNTPTQYAPDIFDYNNKSKFEPPLNYLNSINSKYDYKKIWINTVIKHPVVYLKHCFKFVQSLWFYDPAWILNVNSIQSLLTPPGNKNFYVSSNFSISEQKITFTKFKKEIYSMFYNHCIRINNIIPISLSIILFFITGIIWIANKKNRNNLLLFSFCLAFSSFATALIVILFPTSARSVESRFLSPILPLSIMSLIAFVSFIYDMGGFRKFIKELRGNK